jgi:hypothetical protein
MPVSNRDKLGLPAKPFMYTPFQIAALLELEETTVKNKLLHYEGRSVGVCPKFKMRAYNVMPSDGETEPKWRIPESSLIAYLRFMGIKYYTRNL